MDEQQLKEALKEEKAKAKDLENQASLLQDEMPALEADISAKLEEKYKKLIEGVNADADANVAEEMAVMDEFSKVVDNLNEGSARFESLLARVIEEKEEEA